MATKETDMNNDTVSGKDVSPVELMDNPVFPGRQTEVDDDFYADLVDRILTKQYGKGENNG